MYFLAEEGVFLCVFAIVAAEFCRTAKDTTWAGTKAEQRNYARAPVSNRKTVCSTPECLETAQKILDRINPRENPCNDFYQYACGKWISDHEIPDNETSISEFFFLREKTKLIKQDLMQRMKGSVSSAEIKVKSLYRQCINQEEIERVRSAPLLSVLETWLGGWPLLNETWEPSRFNLYYTLLLLREYGEEPLIQLTVTEDVEDPLENLILISGPATYATIDVLQNDAGRAFTDSYLTYAKNVTSLILGDLRRSDDGSNNSAVLTEIVETEHYFSLSGLTAVEANDVDIYKNKLTLDSLQYRNTFKSAFVKNLTAFIRDAFGPANFSHQIKPSTVIILPNPGFLEKLDELLVMYEKQGDEGKKKLANYIGWQIVSNNADNLAKDYRDAAAQHTQRISGRKTKRDESPEEHCNWIAAKAMPLAVGAIYVRDVVPPDLKSKASMMVEDIKQGFGQLLQAATWMDNVTSERAFAKLQQMMEIVAYPDIMVSKLGLDIAKKYKSIQVQSTFFETMQQIGKAKNIENLELLVKTNIRYDPIENTPDITQINAYYDPQRNLITLLAAILQLPFYNAKSPQYVNYGGIGFILGHEITHGFDDTGSKFDDKGHMVSWWTNTTYALYNQRKQSIIEQYNNYTVPAGKVNGQLTIGENIADNGGLKAAYRGYMQFQRRATEPEPLLPGLEQFSAAQLFFISAGQVWCEKKRVEQQLLDMLTDGHSPSRVRVIGPMSNMPEFATAFSCPLGSAMNQEIKHGVW